MLSGMQFKKLKRKRAAKQRAGRESGTARGLRFGAFELREADGQHLPRRYRPAAIFFDEHELLVFGKPGRNGHPAAGLELLEKCPGNQVRCRGDDDLVEWRVLWPAIVAVSDLELDIPVALARKAHACLFRELLDDFNAVDLVC